MRAACLTLSEGQPNLVRKVAVSHRFPELNEDERAELLRLAHNLAAEYGLSAEGWDKDAMLTVEVRKEAQDEGSADSGREPVVSEGALRSLWRRLAWSHRE